MGSLSYTILYSGSALDMNTSGAEIRQCAKCGKKLNRSYTKVYSKEYCSNACSALGKSLDAYKSVKRQPYWGNCSWAYVAGFFDGEGCIMATRGQFMSASLSQKGPVVLRDIQDFFLSHGITSCLSGERQAHYTLTITNMYMIYKFIMQVQKYSFVKLEKLFDASYHIWKRIAHERY